MVRRSARRAPRRSRLRAAPARRRNQGGALAFLFASPSSRARRAPSSRRATTAAVPRRRAARSGRARGVCNTASPILAAMSPRGRSCERRSVPPRPLRRLPCRQQRRRRRHRRPRRSQRLLPSVRQSHRGCRPHLTLTRARLCPACPSGTCSKEQQTLSTYGGSNR